MPVNCICYSFLLCLCSCKIILALLNGLVKAFFKKMYLQKHFVSCIIEAESEVIWLTIGEKIRLVRKSQPEKMTQTEFGAKLGATRKMITSYELGYVEPPEPILRGICNVYKVNYLWLTGEDEAGGMLAETETVDMRFLEVMSGENEFAQDVMRRFLALDDKDWEDLQRVIEKLKRAGT